MIGWILAGLVGVALLSGNENGDSAHGLIKASHGNCNLCGGRNSTATVIKEYKSPGGCYTYAVVKFRCNKCGRTWTKTYQVT